jgi:hypothetical protein
MSLNRDELVKRMNQASSELLREKGFISFVEILIRMGALTQERYESWRFGKVPCLEQAIAMNLAKINHLLRTFHRNARNGGLRASKTAYMSWGKGPKKPLRFSKSGNPDIEEAYATHFLWPKESGLSLRKHDNPERGAPDSPDSSPGEGQ